MDVIPELRLGLDTEEIRHGIIGFEYDRSKRTCLAITRCLRGALSMSRFKQRRARLRKLFFLAP